MDIRDPYDAAYFQLLEGRVRSSVARVVPSLVECFSPESALDLGCGDGQWTLALAEAGVKSVGVDLARTHRESHPLATFLPGDLTRISVGSLGRADICLCLEVAEHLPDAAADHLVRLITACSGNAIFSAATPGQGGTGHINEQPHAYWAERFASRGFVGDRSWRDRFSADLAVASWYRDNITVFRSGQNGTPEATSSP
jgi:2-polyprenyl-3-methyl-5-hydroxy-6-metoxy-1,4-benzoquinol methylase